MNVFRVLRKLLEYGRPHRKLLWGAFLCMALLGVTTGLLALLLGPAFKFLLSGGELGFGSLGRAFSALSTLDRSTALRLLPFLVATIGAVKAFAYLGQFYAMGLFGQRITLALQADVFQHLLRQPVRQKGKSQTGDLLSMFTSDIAAFELAATYALGSYLRDGILVLVLLGVAIAMDWQLALLSLCLVPLVVVPASRLTRSVFRRAREGQNRLGAIAGLVHEGMGAMKTIQAFNAQKAELQRFDSQAQALEATAVKAAWARGAVPALMEILAAASIAALLAYASVFRAVDAEKLVSFVAAIGLLYQPAKELGRVTQFLIQAVAAGERIFGFLSQPLEQIDGGLDAPVLRHGIELQDVRYAYESGGGLAGVSLSLPIGKTTALVGPSGGGKSTLVSLLLGFDRPHGGRVLYDGQDGRACSLQSIRRQFALVTQEPLLFATTLRENIRFGRPSATDLEVEEAARTSGADAFIRRLPQGYDTELGERGQSLSGGQRQRLAIARAVLSSAPVWVLDEATSNLDPDSEREVLEALRAVSQGRTVVVVAHRLHTVVDASCIFVLAQGQVKESGTHAELLQKDGLYAQLWATQNGQVAA